MRTSRHAFSLVEVLISIVVLALGLLGLAAVFPAVIVEQRVASDAVQGVSMEKSVVEWIEGNAAFRQRSVNDDDAVPSNRRGWRLLLAQPEWSTKGSWVVPLLTSDPPQADTGITLDPVSGGMQVGVGGVRTINVWLADRLYPSAFSSPNDPRFVWDFAARRVEAGKRYVNQTSIPEWADDSVQLVFFVRRIDAGIRLRNVNTLAEAFGLDPMNQPAVANRRVPVAVVPDTAVNSARGTPTMDGFGGDVAPNYSPITVFSYTFLVNDQGPNPSYDRIVPDAVSPEDPRTRNPFYPVDARPYVSQVGQQFVDQLGVVHRVVEVVQASTESPPNPLYLRIDPPLNRRVPEKAAELQESKRMLYTPQLPVAVVVKTIRR